MGDQGDRMERGERESLLGGNRPNSRRNRDEEGVSIHDVMDHTSFLHFGYGRSLVRHARSPLPHCNRCRCRETRRSSLHRLG